MEEDIIRVVRIITYTGSRSAVEYQVAKSIHGIKDIPGRVRFTATTLGEFPDILDPSKPFQPTLEGYPGS